MKTTKEKRDKERLKKEKLSIRVIGKTPEKKKKGATGEFELFKKIALERAIWQFVVAFHIFPDGEFWTKNISLDNLTVTNFSHNISKWRDKTKRLDPDNITVVSRAYHEWQHSLQIPQTNYIN